MTPVLVLALLIPAPLVAGPGCRVEQRVIAWSEDGATALLYQHQTCVPHLPPVSLWRLAPGDGGVKARVEVWRPHALEDGVRARATALATGIKATPLDGAAALPGVLLPHRDPDQRGRGAMGSPFLTDAAAFTSYDGDRAAAAEACGKLFPCGGLCLYEGHYAPARAWLVCAPAAPDRAESPLRYVRILPATPEGGGGPVLDMEKELGRWNGRVLKIMGALAEQLDLVADGESAAAAALLALAALRCDPEVWAAARRFVTDRGIPVDARVRLLEGCDPHVGNEDADFVMALATSDDLPLDLRVAAGRILGLRGETPDRLKGKLWRFKPPKEVMDAIQGKR